MKAGSILRLAIATACCAANVASAVAGPPAEVPGIVIDHIPASTEVYVGSPSIAVLPNGDYVASHDIFGPKATAATDVVTAVFRSADRGRTWKKVSVVPRAFWSSLFVHRGALYLMGINRGSGHIAIRRSDDGGQTWSVPKDHTTGLLSREGSYHCAPVPVIEHAGRLWRAFEHSQAAQPGIGKFGATVLSAPVDSDLLRAESWTMAEPLRSQGSWNGGDLWLWLEGNAVVTPTGQVVDILRAQTKSPDEKAAIVQVSPDGKAMSFDPANGFVDFPGGAKKFSIRFDPESKRYWTVASIVLPRHRAFNPGNIRNTLALTCSPDLRQWSVRSILIYHPDVKKHGFQYVDWLFEGDDLIAVCRTAFDDQQGGAHNFHDANYLTFHRIANFRRLTMADSVPLTTPETVRHETPDVVLTGSGFNIACVEEGGTAFSNRKYAWKGLPANVRGASYTQTGGGQDALILVRAKRDVTLYAATTLAMAQRDLADWTKTDATFHYTDKSETKMALFTRRLKAGQEVFVPQGGWTGTLVIFPSDARP